MVLDSSPWLDEHIGLKRRLARQPLRNVEVQRSRPSLLLLGIISVSEQRRELLRCTWGQLLGPLPLRMRFVLGQNATDRHYGDVISTPVEERLLVASSNRAKTRRASGATYSSLSSFLKMKHFFQYAASAPEPLVAIGDDDVFIQPSMLLAHAILLHEELMSSGSDAALVAGAIEWYSWREATLVATGWDRGAVGAREKGQASWRNCSPKGNGWLRQGGVTVEATNSTPMHDRCFGPLPFLKGPLVILSTSVVQWLNASALVARDVHQATELAAGRARAYRGPGSGRIPQDVSLGFWLSRHPTLKIVELPVFTTWCDKWKFVGDLHELLVAHRVPWERMSWLSESTRRLWSGHAAALGRLSCAGPVCEPGECASELSQTACRMEVMLPPSNASELDYGCYACNCWASNGHQRTWSNGTCRFSRTAVPRIPTDCTSNLWSQPPGLMAGFDPLGPFSESDNHDIVYELSQIG